MTRMFFKKGKKRTYENIQVKNTILEIRRTLNKTIFLTPSLVLTKKDLPLGKEDT